MLLLITITDMLLYHWINIRLNYSQLFTSGILEHFNEYNLNHGSCYYELIKKHILSHLRTKVILNDGF